MKHTSEKKIEDFLRAKASESAEKWMTTTTTKGDTTMKNTDRDILIRILAQVERQSAEARADRETLLQLSRDLAEIRRELSTFSVRGS
tara:strand:+ start:316 stop:579 length:264 start_codon:yes stop_codon:yes gene_type:complete